MLSAATTIRRSEVEARSRATDLIKNKMILLQGGAFPARSRSMLKGFRRGKITILNELTGHYARQIK